MTELDHFYLGQNEPNRSIFMALRDYFLDFDKDISAEWKYKLPFFYYKGKMFCYLWKDKKTNEPYIGVADGYRLEHPLLESGNRKRMKIIRIDPSKDLPVEALDEIFANAIKLQQGKNLQRV